VSNIVFRHNNLSNRVVEKFTIMTLYPSKYGSRDPTQDSESTHVGLHVHTQSRLCTAH